MSWLADSIPPAELQKLQAGPTNRPGRERVLVDQAQNLAKVNAAGVKSSSHRRQHAVGAPHVEMEDMVCARAMTPMTVLTAATKNGGRVPRIPDMARSRRIRAPTSSCSTPTRPIDIRNTRKISAAVVPERRRRSIAPRSPRGRRRTLPCDYSCCRSPWRFP